MSSELKKLSEAIPKVMFNVMKNSSQVVQGFIFLRNRLVLKCEYDEEGCDKLLKDMIINKENVLRYLKHKYIPTFSKKGAIFKDQKCIQSVKVQEDGSLLIHIAKSEPHKIITDTIHVRNLLIAQGFEITNEVKFFIDRVQIAYQDTLLYNVLLKEFKYPIPAPSRMYEKQLLAKYKRLEEVAKIKKRSVKRKFLRYHCKRGLMDWTQLRTIINITDFSPNNIREVCNNVRKENKELGLEIDY